MSAPSASFPFRHLFLLTDLEGVAGVTHWRQTREGGPEQEAARSLLTGEVNAFISAIREACGAREIEPPRITVWDGHGTGGLHLDSLEPVTQTHRHDDPRGFAGVFEHALEAEVPADALVFIGQHAMEGTKGNLAHTYSSLRVKRHLLNGVEIGEFGTRALHAWSRGVPTIFHSGDDTACREATNLIPGIVCVEVKRSLGVTEADCLSHEDACRAIGAASQELLDLNPSHPDWVPRIALEPPYTYRQIKRAKWGIVPRPNRTVAGDDLAEVLRQV